MDKVENLYNQDSVIKLQEMVNEIKVCMFFTKGRGEREDVRPMSAVHTDENGTIWFLASKNSEKVETIQADGYVHLVFSHPGKEMYLDIYGTAGISEDRNVIRNLWNPIAKAWFTKGVEDPDICAIEVKPESGSYWDTQHGKFIEFLSIVSSVVTGKKFGDGVSGKIAVK